MKLIPGVDNPSDGPYALEISLIVTLVLNSWHSREVEEPDLAELTVRTAIGLGDFQPKFRARSRITDPELAPLPALGPPVITVHLVKHDLAVALIDSYQPPAFWVAFRGITCGLEHVA